MPLSLGSRLGPYEILGPLGAGGMGEVYRARDTRLDRTVAVKILPPSAAADPEFKARFDREARTISQLNHPNICVLHDVGESGGSSFLVMELLEGETLAARLQRGALPTDDVLRIAGEIADALDKAHRKGIIHRDLKPANVMLTPTGAKLLDFGLAKPGVVTTSAIETQLASSASLLDAASAGGSNAPALTARGTILGTFQYMAPEQIEGDLADARSDIWSFGCVLYEMVTGRKAFEGKSHASLIASILEKHPAPVSELQPMTPPALGRIVRTCLAKNPDDRFQTAHDLGLQLEWIEEGGSAAGLPAPVIASRKRHERTIFAGIAAVVALAAAAAAWTLKPAPVAPPAVVGRFVDVLPEEQQLTRGGRRTVAISPDGSNVVYVANQQIYLRKLGESVASPIPGTLNNPAEPVFSPDGQSIAFWSAGVSNSTDSEGKIWRIPLTGGTPTPICDAAAPWGMSWIGSQVYVGVQRAIITAPADGGTATELVKADASKQERLGHPWATADGKHLIFAVNTKTWETAQIVAQDLASGERRVLVPGGTSPRLLASGHLVFYRDSTIFAQRFDDETATVSGTPVPMVQSVGYAGFSGAGQFSVADSGTVVYVEGSSAALLTMMWVDRAGKTEAVPGAPARRYIVPRLSPDGTRVAVATQDESPDIFVWDLGRGIETRVTNDETRDTGPIWLDNRELLFATARGGDPGALDVTRRRADLTTERTVVATWSSGMIPSAISPDGKTLIVTVYPSGRATLARLSLEKPQQPEPLVGMTDVSGNGVLSPDGRWIAYDAREGERLEIYVRPYPNVNDARFQISQGGGQWPLWSRDGRELFYVAGVGGNAQRPVTAVPVKAASGTTFDWGPGVRLFNAVPFFRSTARGYDISPDGSKFIVVADPSAPAVAARVVMRFVTNWHEELKARVK